ncbi:MAG: hypothetical protein FWE03_06195 [Firmicutes bacterium]|nr:hypothetical protein [Bacillota bacterium]
MKKEIIEKEFIGEEPKDDLGLTEPIQNEFIDDSIVSEPKIEIPKFVDNSTKIPVETAASFHQPIYAMMVEYVRKHKKQIIQEGDYFIIADIPKQTDDQCLLSMLSLLYADEKSQF